MARNPEADQKQHTQADESGGGIRWQGQSKLSLRQIMSQRKPRERAGGITRHLNHQSCCEDLVITSSLESRDSHTSDDGQGKLVSSGSSWGSVTDPRS